MSAAEKDALNPNEKISNEIKLGLHVYPDSTHTVFHLERWREVGCECGRLKCMRAALSRGRSASQSALDGVDIDIGTSVTALE